MKVGAQHASVSSRAADLDGSAALAERLSRAIDSAIAWAGREQDEAGWWLGPLESNASMEAEWVLTLHILGVKDDWKLPGVLRGLWATQRPDGSWENYRDAPAGDIGTTVECYAALRCAGASADEPRLVAAREWILSHGGVGAVRVFTKFWLALLGEWPWEATPALPPQIIAQPNWSPFSIYRFASWARGTMVPLAILSALRPVHPLPPEARLDELFPDGREAYDYSPRVRRPWYTAGGLFLAADRGLRWLDEHGISPGRERAIRSCAEWIIARQEADGCWGGIQPPWVYSLIALRAVGYALDHPVMARGIRAFDPPWAYERDGATYLQACMSPVWDTVLMMQALLDCGHDAASSPQLARALPWLLAEQVDGPGDWQQLTRNLPNGGWAFEFHNDWYPDIDDTAVVLLVLARLREAGAKGLTEPIGRALAWVRGMACANGAWAAFDRDNTNVLLSQIPFMDFGEALDPPSADVTAHVVEAMAALGVPREERQMRRAVEYLWAEQEDDGSWFGRWGVNHIYGTAAVLPALRAAGEDMSQERVCRATAWIASRQNADGGWGESCASYMDVAQRGRGASTPSQTGWALIALVAGGGHEHDGALTAGLDYLLRTQRDDGTWDETAYTGTGFPGYGSGRRVDIAQDGATNSQGTELGRGFLIGYNLYRHYFPLAAMGRARQHLGLA